MDICFYFVYEPFSCLQSLCPWYLFYNFAVKWDFELQEAIIFCWKTILTGKNLGISRKDRKIFTKNNDLVIFYCFAAENWDVSLKLCSLKSYLNASFQYNAKNFFSGFNSIPVQLERICLPLCLLTLLKTWFYFFRFRPVIYLGICLDAPFKFGIVDGNIF